MESESRLQTPKAHQEKSVVPTMILFHMFHDLSNRSTNWRTIVQMLEPLEDVSLLDLHKYHSKRDTQDVPLHSLPQVIIKMNSHQKQSLLYDKARPVWVLTDICQLHINHTLYRILLQTVGMTEILDFPQ